MESNQSLRGHAIRVLVADNTQIHTQLLADALKRDAGLEVIASDPNSRAFLAAAELHDADVLLISSTLDEEPNRGLEVLRQLRASRPELKAVVLLDSSKEEVILNAFRSGARGVFRRHESIETLKKCVRCIYDGQIWANSEEMALALRALAASPTVHAVNANGRTLLSKREQQVVQSLAEGLTNQEIAERLGLSQHTVKNYLFRVFDKLGVSNRIELLFMTLSDPNAISSTAGNGAKASGLSSWEHSPLVDCEKAAAEGVCMAQLAMAQRTGSKNPIVAYTWFLILSEQISRAKKELQRTMTPEQMVEAERRAAEWLNRPKKKQSSPTERNGGRFVATAGAAAAD